MAQRLALNVIIHIGPGNEVARRRMAVSEAMETVEGAKLELWGALRDHLRPLGATGQVTPPLTRWLCDQGFSESSCRACRASDGRWLLLGGHGPHQGPALPAVHRHLPLPNRRGSPIDTSRHPDPGACSRSDPAAMPCSKSSGLACCWHRAARDTRPRPVPGGCSLGDPAARLAA
jgi:hypothetical protein